VEAKAVFGLMFRLIVRDRLTAKREAELKKGGIIMPTARSRKRAARLERFKRNIMIWPVFILALEYILTGINAPYYHNYGDLRIG
jgi:hypothetical protein